MSHEKRFIHVLVQFVIEKFCHKFNSFLIPKFHFSFRQISFLISHAVLISILIRHPSDRFDIASILNVLFLEMFCFTYKFILFFLCAFVSWMLCIMAGRIFLLGCKYSHLLCAFFATYDMECIVIYYDKYFVNEIWNVHVTCMLKNELRTSFDLSHSYLLTHSSTHSFSPNISFITDTDKNNCKKWWW